MLIIMAFAYIYYFLSKEMIIFVIMKNLMMVKFIGTRYFVFMIYYFYFFYFYDVKDKEYPNFKLE